MKKQSHPLTHNRRRVFRTLSFSPYPITEYATYDLIDSYSQRHCASYQNIFIVLPNHGLSEERWRAVYGNFFGSPLLDEPITLWPSGEQLRFKDDPEKFMRKLCYQYKSPYFYATRPVIRQRKS